MFRPSMNLENWVFWTSLFLAYYVVQKFRLDLQFSTKNQFHGRTDGWAPWLRMNYELRELLKCESMHSLMVCEVRRSSCLGWGLTAIVVGKLWTICIDKVRPTPKRYLGVLTRISVVASNTSTALKKRKIHPNE